MIVQIYGRGILKVVKFKIFSGNFVGEDNQPDTKVNRWLEEHPEVRIVDWKYAMTDYNGDICIYYVVED